MACNFETLWLTFYSEIFAWRATSSHTGGNSAAFNYFSDTPGVGDCFYFYTNQIFSGIRLTVGTPMNGSPTFVWEYAKYNNNWSTLRVTNADAITKSGVQDVRWTPPSDWSAATTNARPAFRVRLRLTGVTGVTEGGANATNKAQFLFHAFQVTGAGVNMGTIATHDAATAYTLLPATTPAASLTPLECPFKKSGIVGKIDITLAGCTVGAGDTVVLTGIDYDNAALTETIDVSGSGSTTYTTANTFKDVTDVACNGFADGTICVATKNIGLVRNTGGSVYQIDASIIIGDPAIPTTFVQTKAAYNFIFISSYLCAYGEDTEVTLGAVESSGDISHAQDIVFIYFANLGVNVYDNACRLSQGATLNLYGVTFLQPSCSGMSIGYSLSGGNYRIQDVVMDSGNRLSMNGTFLSTNGLWVRNMDGGGGGFPSFSTVPVGLVINNTINATNNRNKALTVRDSYLEGFSDYNNLDAGRYHKFIDCPGLKPDDFSNTRTNTAFIGDGCYLQKTFNLKVIDVAFQVIEAATVEMRDNTDAVVFSVQTGADGTIAEQIVTWQKGVWPPSTVGINFTDYTPHTVTISKAGYKTRVIQYEMDEPRVEIEMLELDAVPPTAPSALTATAASQTQIDLAWADNSDDETGFRIERSLDGSTLWTHIATVDTGVESYSDTGLECGTTYYYRVCAVNVNGNSAYTGTAHASTNACTSITTLTATAASQTEIALAWTVSGADKDGFRIERSPDGTSDWTHITTAGAAVTSYTDDGLECGTKYYYRVCPVLNGENLAFSATASVTTNACTVPVVLMELESPIP